MKQDESNAMSKSNIEERTNKWLANTINNQHVSNTSKILQISQHAAKPNINVTTASTQNTSAVDVNADTNIALNILKLLQEYSYKSSTPTTVKPVEQTTPTADDGEELIDWLDAILALAEEPDVLAAAIELYEESTAINDSNDNILTSKDTRNLHHHGSEHGARKTNSHPTLHVKGDYTKMTYKRIQNKVNKTENRVGAFRPLSAIGDAFNDTNNTEQVSTTPPVRHYVNLDIDDIHELALNKETEKNVEAKILQYLLSNVSLHRTVANPIKSDQNKTFIEQITDAELSARWLIIAVCVTFSVTCLCALCVGVAVVKGSQKKFSPNEWWNQKEDNSDDNMWLGSRSNDDLELGGSSRFTELYSLQGDELKKQVSKMIDDIGSASTSTASGSVR